jgi:acyl-CoA reductase-like NAD-dependent aldehyde dehydrogenase
LAEAERSAEAFRFASLEAKAEHGEIVPMDASPVSAGCFGFAIRVPIGVIGAITLGARIEVGGEAVSNCLRPTVLTGVTRDMQVMCSEVFAPIVSVLPFDTFDEALDMADDSVYGLQAGVYTRDIGKAFKAIRRLDVGGAIINDVPTFRVDHMTYGGNKESGLGREGVRFAMEEMTNIKMVCFNL